MKGNDKLLGKAILSKAFLLPFWKKGSTLKAKEKKKIKKIKIKNAPFLSITKTCLFKYIENFTSKN